MRIMKVCGIATALLIGAWVPSSVNAEARSTTWSMEGLMSDACQCHVFCPCELAQKPTYGHCDDTAILHIESGHYGSVKLDGKRIVIVSQSPEGERLVDTVGRLNFARMYVPEDASDEEARALAEMARRVFGTWVSTKVARISPDETIHKVPMNVSIEPLRHRVSIPGVLELDIQALIGWDGENPVSVRNGPAAGPGMEDILVAQSSAYRVTDAHIDWNYAGRSASMRAVKLSGSVDQEIEQGPPAGATEQGHEHGSHDHH